MKPQPTISNRGDFKRLAEGLYQYSLSQEYYARFRFRGQRIMQKLGSTENPCTSLPEAKRLLRDLRNSLEHTDTRKSNKTFGETVSEYEAVLHCAPKTRIYKNLHLKRLRTEFPLRLTTRVRDIQKTDIIRFLTQYNHLSAAGWNSILTVVRDVFRYAVDDGVIARSPAESIKYRKREDKQKRLIPSQKEFEQIVEHVRSQKFSDTAKASAELIEFMGLAGLGQAECADLAWGDINFEAGRITIIRRKTSREFFIPIFPQLQPLLERMAAERNSLDAAQKVFSVKDPKIAIDGACKRMNLPRYSARAFRRMFITRCVELGIDAQTIATWQGHKDGGQLILRVYARVSEQHNRKMAALVRTSP